MMLLIMFTVRLLAGNLPYSGHRLKPIICIYKVNSKRKGGGVLVDAQICFLKWQNTNT